MHNKEPIFLLDVMPILHEQFRASKQYLLNSRGQDTVVITETLRVLQGIFDKFKPQNLALVFDSQTGYFRSELYPEYKANRPEKDRQLVAQIDAFMELCRLLGFPVFCVPNYEAEDVIATIAQYFAPQGHQVTICSSDQDFIKIIAENITLIRLKSCSYSNLEEATIYDLHNAHELYGVPLESTIDYLALVGNHSDNIKGIEGVGQSTASELIHEYGSLDQIYQAIDNKLFFTEIGKYNLKKSINLLKFSRPDVYLCAQILRLKTDVDLGELSIKSLQMRPTYFTLLAEFLRKWELKTISNEIARGAYSFWSEAEKVPELYQQVLQRQPKFAPTQLLPQYKKKVKKSSTLINEDYFEIIAEEDEEAYELTPADLEICTRKQQFTGDFAAFIANATLKPLFQIKDYLATEHEQLNCDLVAKFAQQPQMQRWVCALAQARAEIANLLKSTVSVSINYHFKEDKKSSTAAISIALLHRAQESLNTSEFTIPNDFQAISDQGLVTTCYSFSSTSQSEWEQLALSASDLELMRQALREVLVKPLFYAGKSHFTFKELEAQPSLLDPSLELELNPVTQVYTYKLNDFLQDLNFTAQQGLLIGKQVHDLDVVCHLHNCTTSKNSLLETVNSQFGLELEGKDDSQAQINLHCELAIFMNCMGILLARIMQTSLYRHIEQHLYQVLHYMHCSQLAFNLQKFNEIRKPFKLEQEKTSEDIVALVPESRGLDFSKHENIKYILFDVLGLTKIEDGKIDNNTLSRYPHKVAKLIRKLKNCKSIYNKFEKFLKQADINPKQAHHQIQFSFALTGHNSGIINSVPSFTVLPEDEEIKMRAQVCDCCAAPEPNHKLVYFEFDALNLRIAAHLSQDPNLIADLNSNDDITLFMARKFFAADFAQEQEATELQRLIGLVITNKIEAKSIKKVLTEEIGMPSLKVSRLLEVFYTSYPKLDKYLASLLERAKVTEFTTTMLERVIFNKDINSSNPMARKGEFKIAKYYPILGSAAEILKLALLQLLEPLVNEMSQAMPIVTTESGVLIKMPADMVETYVPRIQQIMQNSAQQANVSFPVKYYIGDTWTGYELIP